MNRLVMATLALPFTRYEQWAAGLIDPGAREEREHAVQHDDQA